MAESVVTLRVDASGATRALQGVQNKTNALERSFGSLKTAIGGIGLGLLARQAVRTSVNFDKLKLRLGLLTKGTGDFAAAQKIATDAQKLFGLSATEALDGVTNITARLKPLGVSLEDIRTTFIGFNTAAKLGGANAQEASNAFRQLAQALGSGRLAGDEFRSVSEQIPLILKPLADELDVDVGKLKELAAQGKLTSDVVIRALRKLGATGSEDLKKILENDPTQVFKNLSNEAENLSRAVGEQLTPVLLPVVKALTELTKAAGDFVNSPIGQTAAIFAAIAFAAKGVSLLLPIVAAGLIKVAAAGGLVTIALNAIPFVAVATGIGAIVTQLIKQRKEQEKVTQAIKDGEKAQLEALEADLGIKMAKEIAKINQSNDKRTIAAAERRLALLREQMQPIKERLDIIIQENAELEKTNKLKEKAIENQKKLKEEADKYREKIEAIGKEIEENIKDNLKEAIKGAQSFGDAVNNVLDRIKDKLLDLALDEVFKNFQSGFNQKEGGKKDAGGLLGGIIGGIFGGGKNKKNQTNTADEFLQSAQGFARGGRPPVNKISVVGEKGPEIFVPSVAGTIIPNNKLGGGDSITNIVNVSVDAAGSSVQGDQASSQQLGQTIALVVQETLVREKRSGGLLA